MPRGDRKGPDGLGPKTGRSLGFCSGEDTPGYVSNLPGMGMGRGPRDGRGRGRGFGNSEYNPRGERRPRDGRGRGYRD